MSRSLSRRTEVGISVAILVYAGLVIAAILNFGLEGDGSPWIPSLAVLLLVYFANPRNIVETRDLFRNLGTKGKLVFILGALISAVLITVAFVRVTRGLGGSVKYLYAGVMMWLIITIALTKRARRNQTQ
ncbi:MAG TPA: hypothetical protein VF251_00165 [Pyrinomonadaceae bacterium]